MHRDQFEPRWNPNLSKPEIKSGKPYHCNGRDMSSCIKWTHLLSLVGKIQSIKYFPILFFSINLCLVLIDLLVLISFLLETYSKRSKYAKYPGIKQNCKGEKVWKNDAYHYGSIFWHLFSNVPFEKGKARKMFHFFFSTFVIYFCKNNL